jgi:putative membrane protein insertion efficiency factor
MNYMKKIALLLIRFYQLAISPHYPPCCRYYPSCSSYALEAVEKHGFLKGSFMALRRLLRCHPFHAGGYDPVPERVNAQIQCKEI